MIKYDDPNQIDPAPNGNDDGEDNAKDVSKCGFAKDRGDANKYFCDPVDDGDEKQKDLNQAGL